MHKGGLHVSAIERDPNSYQHVNPARVGNRLRVLIRGRGGVVTVVGRFYFPLDNSISLSRERAARRFQLAATHVKEGKKFTLLLFIIECGTVS